MSITFYAARVTEDAEGRTIHMVSDLDHLSVNVSNASACAILDRLGLDAEMWGEVAAEDFLGRAMVANVGRFDDGIEASSERGQSGAVFIDCGIRSGYFDDRLSSLAELASAAAARGFLVGWA